MPQKPKLFVEKSVFPVKLIDEKLSEIIGCGSFALKPDTHYSLTATFEVVSTEPSKALVKDLRIGEL